MEEAVLPLVGLASVYGRISHGLIVAIMFSWLVNRVPTPVHRTPPRNSRPNDQGLDEPLVSLYNPGDQTRLSLRGGSG